MKTVVTHISPDLDALTSAWLIKRFMPGWMEADLAFTPAGTTLENKPVDSDPNIIHVDTGLGRFDHHQVEDRGLCAAKLVLNHLIKENSLKTDQIAVLTRMVDFVIVDDNFQDVFFNEPDADTYDFTLHRLIDGLKGVERDDQRRADIGFILLDAALQNFRNKIRAEKEITAGFTFQSWLGKTLAIETKVNDAVKLALKKGYKLVVKKDPERGFVSIKSLPVKELNLSPLYDALLKEDPKATWFLHVSKNMLLNGSTKNPTMTPSKLTLQRLIEIIKAMS